MKPEFRKRLEIEPRLAIIFLVIAVPFVLVGSLLNLGWVRAEMDQMVGEKLLGGTAVDTARQLDGYLLSSLTTATVLAASPNLYEAVAASNDRYPFDADEIERRLTAIDEEWREKRGAVPRALNIVGNPTSSYLRKVSQIEPAYREVLLTDRQGALVAATNITTDFYQADEAWWQEAFGEGARGALYLSAVRFDKSVGGYVIEVAVPLVREISEDEVEVAGVLKVVTAAEGLFSVIEAVKRGETGHALLVNTSDGSVVKGPDPGDFMKRDFAALSRLREALSSGARFFTARDGERVWVAGVARLPEPTPVSFRDWVIVVRQDAEEAHAPTLAATRYLVIFFLAMGFLVVAFTLYMNHRLRVPLEASDLKQEMDRLDDKQTGGSTP